MYLTKDPPSTPIAIPEFTQNATVADPISTRSSEDDTELSSDSEEEDDDFEISNKYYDSSNPAFASNSDLKADNQLYDESRYLKNYHWVYFNHHKNGYMCKTCETFFGNQGCPISQGEEVLGHITE